MFNDYCNYLFQGQIVRYKGDPLQDFTLIRFLDRFVFKNPKKPDEESEFLTSYQNI